MSIARELGLLAWFMVRFPFYVALIIGAISWALLVGSVRESVARLTRR